MISKERAGAEAGGWAGLLAWRDAPEFGVGEWVVLLVWAAVAGAAVPRHEAWGDEAQAWMLARGNGLWALFRYRLHYEGTPGLWHLLLQGMVVMGAPWGAVRWFAAGLAGVGVWVWLRWSPLPAVVRWVVPLGFWMMYQYAVVARSYVLFPGLLFGVCALYVQRPRRVVWFAVMAGLLGNLCLQGALVAGVLGVLYAVDLWRDRRSQEARPGAPGLRGYGISRRRLWLAMGVFTGFAGVSGYTALPAPDVNFAVQGAVREGVVHRVLVRVVGETSRVGPASGKVEALSGTAAAGARSGGGWRERMAGRVEESDGATALVEMASEALWPVATWNWVGVLFYGAVVAWMWGRGGMRYLLPAVVVWIVGEFLWTTDHHAGMLLLTVVAGVWLAAGSERRAGAWVERGVIWVMALVLGVQVVWAGAAVWRDWVGVYDPGVEVAGYLAGSLAETTVPAGKGGLGEEARSQRRDLGHPVLVAGFHFWTVAVQPYFVGQPFYNQPARYWQWSSHVTTDGDVEGVLRMRPEMVVVGVERPLAGAMRNQVLPLSSGGGEDGVVKELEAGGYGVRRRFCGERFSRMGSSFEVCDLVLERKP